MNQACLKLPLHNLHQQPVWIFRRHQRPVRLRDKLDPLGLERCHGLVDVGDEIGQPPDARLEFIGARRRRWHDLHQLEERTARPQPHLTKAAGSQAHMGCHICRNLDVEDNFEAQLLVVKLERFVEVAADDAVIDDGMCLLEPDYLTSNARR